MKHLLKLILENISDEKIKTLKDFIDNNATDDDINKLYNTYIKINGVKNGGNFDMLKKWISDKMNNDNKIDHTKIFQRAVFSACEKYSCYEQIISLASDQSKEKPSKNAFLELNLKENNLITFKKICEQFSDKNYNIPKEFFVSIFKTEGSGQPVIGKGEYLLRLLSQYPSKDSKGGDVIINNIPIEVKNLIENEASLGNNLKGNSELIFNFLNEFIDDNIKSQTISSNTKFESNENTQNIKKAIDIISKRKSEDIINIFKKHINEFYFDNSKVKHNFDNVIKLAIEKLQKLTDNYNFNQFIKIFTTLYVIIYCVEEDAKYLCLIKNNGNKDNIDFTFNFISVNNDKQTFENILSNNEFPFFRIRSSSGKQFIQLKY